MRALGIWGKFSPAIGYRIENRFQRGDALFVAGIDGYGPGQDPSAGWAADRAGGTSATSCTRFLRLPGNRAEGAVLRTSPASA